MFAQQPVSFGRYELIYRLGQGGMGEVHLARLTGAAGFEKLYVLKTILPQMSGDPQFVQRFQHEGRLLVHLQHSNIAQVYDMGEVDGTFFMAVEYVAGVDLSRVLGRARQLGAAVPVPIALYVGQQVAEALGYAHRKTGTEGQSLGIVHRDISPHNVMVSYEGEVKVIDFGLAKSSAGSAHTLPSTVMGKLGYMSPEQARAEKVDHRSDIYSAGVVLWEMLAGRRLFDGESVGQMLAAMAHPVIPALRSVRPDVSASLEKVVHRALAPAPGDRYARADELARALNEELVREGRHAGAEETGTYLRALCPEEFAEQRRLISTLNRRVAGAEMEGTLLRGGDGGPSAQSYPGSHGGAPAYVTPQPGMPGSGGVPAAPGAGGMTGAYGSGRVPVAQGSGGMSGTYGAGGVPPAHGAGGMPGAYGAGGMPAGHGSGGVPAGHGSGGMPGAYGSGGMPAGHGSGGMPGAQGSGGMPGAYGPGGMPGPQGSGGMPGAYGPGSMPGAQLPGNMPAAYGSGGVPGAYGSGPQGVAPAQRSRGPLIALGALSLLLAGALGAVLLTRGDDQPTPAPVAKVEPAPAPPAPVQAAAEPVAPAQPAEPVAAPPSEPAPTYELVTVDPVYEVIEDRGEHYIKAGREEGVRMGIDVQLVGPAAGDGRRPLYGTAVVMDVRGHLARVRPDAKLPEGATLFASFTPEPRRERLRNITRRQSSRTTAEPVETASPAEPAPVESKPEVAAAAEPPPLKGRATIGGFGPAKGLTVYNQENRHWTKCEFRLPSNKRYLVSRLAAGDQERVMLIKFRQDGTTYDRENTWVNVTCNEGSARFTIR